jgi:DNA end-binding protein Ku
VPEADRLDQAARARTFWSGTITFGLVSIPVALLAANRSVRPSLRMVSPAGTPLSRRYYTARDGKPLEPDDIVRGYEVEKDRFVVIDDEELERLAPERTRDIDLRVFVPASEIDPMHFERAYYLAPAGNSTKAYRLLARVMEETGRAGIATFVMRAKEYLVAILAEKGILRAETLRFADEVRTPEDVGLPEPQEPPAAEVKRMEKEIEKLAEKRLDTRELTDASAERLLKLVKKKVKAGDDVVRAERPRDEGAPVIDLMEILKRSISGAGEEPAGKRATGSSASTASDLEGRSKSELYEEAKKLDIPGRSGMSKEDLIEAIRRSA